MTASLQRTSFAAGTLVAAALLSSNGIFVHASSRNVAAFGLSRRDTLQKASAAFLGGLTFLDPSPAFADDDEVPFLAEEATEDLLWMAEADKEDDTPSPSEEAPKEPLTLAEAVKGEPTKTADSSTPEPTESRKEAEKIPSPAEKAPTEEPLLLAEAEKEKVEPTMTSPSHKVDSIIPEQSKSPEKKDDSPSLSEEAPTEEPSLLLAEADVEPPTTSDSITPEPSPSLLPPVVEQVIQEASALGAFSTGGHNYRLVISVVD